MTFCCCVIMEFYLIDFVDNALVIFPLNSRPSENHEIETPCIMAKCF